MIKFKLIFFISFFLIYHLNIVFSETNIAPTISANASLQNIFSSLFKMECSTDPIGCSGLFPLRNENESEIGILKNGNESLIKRVELLKNAKSSIRIQALIFNADESGLIISDILKQKAHVIPVKVIVDAASNLGIKTQWMYFDLKQNGVEVEGYEAGYLELINELSQKDPLIINKRNHEKMWIIDGNKENGSAIVGGLNIANEYFDVNEDNNKNWRDQDIIVKGKIVKDITSTFDRNFAHFKNIKKTRPKLFKKEFFNTDKYWNFTNKYIFSISKLKIPFKINESIYNKILNLLEKKININFEKSNARFFQNRPRYQETYIKQLYTGLINASNKEILISNAYFIPSKAMRDALINAVKRGVKVYITTNSEQTNDTLILPAVSRYFYNELISINNEISLFSEKFLRIFEWEGNTNIKGTLHAKYAIFDRNAAIVGSYNLDPRSEIHNSETAITFLNEKLALELTDLFYQDLKYSREIEFEETTQYKYPADPWKDLFLDVSIWAKDWL